MSPEEVMNEIEFSISHLNRMLTELKIEPPTILLQSRDDLFRLKHAMPAPMLHAASMRSGETRIAGVTVRVEEPIKIIPKSR